MAAQRTLRMHLETFHQTFSNELTEESTLAPQPRNIQTPLRQHQLAVIHAMEQKERALKTGLQVQDSNLFSNYAILGDRVGVGKTLMVLGYISHTIDQVEPSEVLQLHERSSSSFFSVSLKTPSRPRFKNLIVVPHTIYRQWQESISNQTNLAVYFLKTLRHLDSDDFVQTLENADVTLISNTLLPSLVNSLRAREIEPLWHRVFYDEADTIKITATTPTPPSLFVWYITASFSNFLFSNQCYHSYLLRQIPEDFIERLHPDLQEIIQGLIQNHPTTHFFRATSYQYFKKHIDSTHPLRGHLIIRTSKSFSRTSLALPQLHMEVIRCRTPARDRLIENILPESIKDMVHAGDISGALINLGVSSHTPLTLVNAVTEFKRQQLLKEQESLEHKQTFNYNSEEERQLSIQRSEERIIKLEEQISTVETRLKEVSKDSCAICFDSPETPCVTPCCSRVFCASCVLSWYTRVPNCPLCRVSFHPNQLIQLGVTQNIVTPKDEPNKLLKKPDTLLKLFRENPKGRFIVYSRFDNPFYHIHEKLSERFTIVQLQGNKDTIANIINDFNDGYINALYINSRQATAGLNILGATHVIFYHKMNDEEQKNILGRAYRLGRTTPLHAISLLHERE